MARLNQVLNYPMLDYTDVEHYFDQAISELNTSLRIGIKPLSVTIKEHSESFKHAPNVVILSAPVEGDLAAIPNKKDEAPNVYYDEATGKFGVRNNGMYTFYDKVYGVYTGISSTGSVSYTYQTVQYSSNIAAWAPYENNIFRTINLIDYFPMDVINLFIIPYVCFKFTVRNGGDASIFVDEFTQGFQQIQTSYDIPNFVILSTQAGKPAYTVDVKENVSNLNTTIPTRAIYDSMKVGNAFMPNYGGMYDNGGWGL